ncbi:hypothetical protein AB4Z18_02090 [Leifsonia sp. 2TAF2]|uniref:hypothetical protein n=1 Tax=Leifsonia sp. 2TAF2 TaxID=3233009 RepID=UPI003F97679E
MSEEDLGSHESHAEQLRARVSVSGLTSQELRLAALGAAIDDRDAPEPYGTLVRQIIADSARVSDGQVLAVREAAGSDKAAFEVILTAAIGAGLARWDAAQRAITEAKDAAP